MGKFQFFKQLDQMDCGPTCLRMIGKFHGKVFSAESLRRKTYLTKEGVSLAGISEAAESIGFRTLAANISFDKLAEEAPLPCIVHWRKRHFIIVYQVKKKTVYVADPAFGLIKYSTEEFIKGWATNLKQNDAGAALFLEPTPAFYEQVETAEAIDISFFFSYLKPYRRYFLQIFLGMLLGGGLQLIFPFLTQSIVDIGINTQDISFINLILIAQTMLFFSRSMVEFIRSWIILHIGTRINVSIISDFLIKLMKLPISFFDRKMIGDLMQRIGDHRRVQSFVSSTTLNTIFSFISLVVFSIVLSFYSLTILLIFFLGSGLYVLWVFLFLKKRKELDYKFFQRNSLNQNALIQLISGIRDIKLHNSERRKRWEWEGLQAQLFRMNMTSLKVSQYQQMGSSFINEIKNIIITITSAKLVIDGQITLGMMLSVQYIIGQLNGPIGQLIGFINSYQDAKISLERLSEIHNKPDEEINNQTKSHSLPHDKAILLDNVSFKYEGDQSTLTLKNINLKIPQGKITALVGSSGSGKTTLIKLLLKFYEPTEGKISVDGIDIWNITNYAWREDCGAVLQDGFIFADTIARNIAVGDQNIDYPKLVSAVRMANIEEFIESLPLGYETKIGGGDGHGISYGQRQRILIARAVYKEPQLIFFDEATSALDATNESIILSNLAKFFEGRTVLIAAHRLSTIKNADQIIVLDKGEIVEVGDHSGLLDQRGFYYKLVHNQLESFKHA